MPDQVRVWGPGSLSNLGPGFDTLGVALSRIGDVVEVSRADRPGVCLEAGGGVSETPRDPESNTAARASASVLRRFAPEAGVSLRIVKGIRPGSGLGSSAASASAAALGTALLLGLKEKGDVVEAALDGEAGVSGARHGDNVLPSLMGGAVLTASDQPERFRRLRLPTAVHVAVVRPDIPVLTKEARAMLPKVVPLRDAVHNASSLAFLVDALNAGDLEAFGFAIEQDRLVEPVRARLVPGYHEILAAAREAGALGAALSGSGPALFAVCPDAAAGKAILEAMILATGQAGHQVRGIVTTVDEEGARLTDRTTPDFEI